MIKKSFSPKVKIKKKTKLKLPIIQTFIILKQIKKPLCYRGLNTALFCRLVDKKQKLMSKQEKNFAKGKKIIL